MNTIIRRFQTGEEETLWQLYRDTTHLINGQDYTNAQCEYWAPWDKNIGEWEGHVRIRNPFVAECNGAIVGFAELEPDGHIDYFYCHHQWQRKGVGTLLYDAIEREACRLLLDCLYTEVSITAREFFLSRGFEIVGEEDNFICGASAKRYLMRKKIAGQDLAPQLYRALLDSINSPIVFVDNDHIIRYLNKAARVRYYQLRGNANLIGKSIYDCHNQASQEEMGRLYQRLIAGEDEIFLNINRFQERVTVVGVRDADGELLGYYERFEKIIN